MARRGSPADQQFAFELFESATSVDDGSASAALVRRVEEVAALAHGERGRQSSGERAVKAGAPLVEDRETNAREMNAREMNARETNARETNDPEMNDGEMEEGDGAVDSLTIAEFYDRVKRALTRSFPSEIWVTGEIRGLRESRGHRFLELADEGAETVGRAAAQQLEVVCWAREWPGVAGALAEAGVNLEVGRVVRVRGKVNVWEGGSKLRFTLTALDVEALLGGIAAARRRLLSALERDGLLDANARQPLALVPLRIGVVTSPGSEAHRDFVGQLERSGFAFEVLLEPSLVQGAEAPRQLAAALGRLAARAPDLVVVVRGGGARGDLAAFDSEEVARAIATAPFPVWTGIGHTGDRSVADDVAQRALITPTACGEAVVAVVGDYWETTLSRAATLSRLARARLDGAASRLHGSAGAVTRGARHQLARRADELVVAKASLSRSVVTRVEREQVSVGGRAVQLGLSGQRALGRVEQESRRYAQVLRAYDPARQLSRGWSLTRNLSGQLVRSVAGLDPGTELIIRVADGEVRSSVTGITGDSPSAESDALVAAKDKASSPSKVRRGERAKS